MAWRAPNRDPGAIFHVMLRGNGGRHVFIDESVRIRFHDLLEEGVKPFHVHIHARCLMSNHANETGSVLREDFHAGARGGTIPVDDHPHEYALRRAADNTKRSLSMEEIITHVCKGAGSNPRLAQTLARSGTTPKPGQ